MEANGELNFTSPEQQDGNKKRSSEGGRQSPPFSPTKTKVPRHRPSDIDDQLVKAGETLQYCMFSDDIAPSNYEVPRYPIQEKESREYFERQLSQSMPPPGVHSSVPAERAQSNKPRFSHISKMDSIIPQQIAATMEEEYELLPDFQRISVSGEDTSGVPFKDLQSASKMLVRALMLREKYMAMSQQTFPQVAARFLESLEGDEAFGALKSGFVRLTSLEDIRTKRALSDHPIHAPPRHGDPFEVKFNSPANCVLRFEKGVMCVYPSQGAADSNKPFDWIHPNLEEFLKDQKMMFALISDGPLKSFCYRRLSYLSHKYQLHVLLNELKESAAQKEVPHRDFYNVHKVDTHVHASSGMNQKHLLRFIKKTMKTCKDDVVCKNKDGHTMTLAEVFCFPHCLLLV